MFSRVTTTLLVLCLFLAGLLNAQVTSRISGSVVDPSGASIPSATVELFLPDGSRASFSATTTGEGLFSMTGVPSGVYKVVVTAQGFKKYTESNVTLTPGTETALNAIKLDVGGTAEVVEVTATSAGVQTGNAEISMSISREQIKELPLLNRSPQAFVLTQAGVSSGRGATVINGQRTTFTNVTLDGINIQDNFIRTNAVDFSPNLLLLDQVAEMTVSTSNTNPAAGGGASQLIFVSPSGTNTFHGGFFWSNRNNALAANTWFNNRDKIAKPFLNQNQTGANVGGRIIKDKLFFFVNFEAFRSRQQSAQNRTILTPDAAAGIFTYLDTAGNVRKVNIFTATGLAADPTALGIIKLIPTGDKINNNRAGDSTATLLRNTGGYSFNQRNNRDRNNTTVKMDYNLSPRNTITGTFLYNTDLLDRPDVTTTSYSLAPLVANDDIVKAMSFGWRTNPTSRITNEARMGFNLAPALFISTENFPTAILAPPSFSNPLNTFRSQGRYTDTYNFADNVAWVKGKHSFQFGYQQEIIYVAPYNDAGITGTYTLGTGTGNTGLSATQLPGVSSNDLTAANNLLSSEVGFITSYTQTFNALSQTSGFVKGATNVRHYKNSNYAVYFTDSWKIRPRLTLNLGMRYDIYSPVTEENGVALLPNLVNNNPVTSLTGGNNTLNFAGGGTGRDFYHFDKNNFGPNVGFAWSIGRESRTVVRGGYSVNFVNDENVVSTSGNVGNNAGLAQTVTGTGLSARISTGLPPITTPVFAVPRTFLDNYNLNSQSTFTLLDPNLATPYVQQFNIGIQHEYKGVLFDLRYVGNHGTKLYRSVDLNQINFNASGFLADFQRAQQNGFLAQARNGTFDPAYNAAITGSQPLTVFPLFTAGGNLANATNRTLIQQGEVAELARTYQINKQNGPVNFFPNGLAQNLWLLSNYSNSTYNGLQFDIRSREHRGLQGQLNYTYSKVLSDASSGSENNFQARQEALLDNNNPKLERSRAPFDLTHVIKGNFVYKLPAGNGHRFSYKPLNKLIGGWQMSGLFTKESGAPFSVLSGRGTFVRAGQSANNTVNTTQTRDQLNQVFQLRFAGNGPYFVNAANIGTDGRGVSSDGAAAFSGQLFTQPGAGTIGSLQRRAFSGPWVFAADFGLSKVTKITERQSIILKMNASNIFNHPTFGFGDQTVTATNFGQVVGTFFGRRVIQFEAQYRF